MANSLDPGQTALKRAVRSGSKLFAVYMYLSVCSLFVQTFWIFMVLLIKLSTCLSTLGYLAKSWKS